jgi:hypothetical protein
MRYARGEELIFHHKQETPDFALETSSGQLVGAEMSEVPYSSDKAAEMDAEALVLKTLEAAMADSPIEIRIGGPSHRSNPRFWRDIASEAEDLGNWAAREFDRVGEHPTTLCHPRFNIGLEVALRDTAPIIWTYSIQGDTSEDDRTTEEEFSRSIYTRLRSKLFKRTSSGQERPRQPPSIRPCHLVFYPNSADFGLDYERIRQRVQQILDFDPSVYFDDIWISSERMIMPLL